MCAKEAPRTRKPESPQKKKADLQEEWSKDQLLDVLTQALMTDEIQQSHFDLKDDKYAEDVLGGVKAARHAVGESLAHVLEKPLEKVLGVEELRGTIEQMRSECSVCRKNLIDLVDRVKEDDVMRTLKPHADFQNRLEEHLQEKRVIAKHVVDTYFRDPGIRCFIQASTLAVLIAEEIVHQNIREMLVHTNSVFFPPMVLQDGGGRIVYAFCGGEFDGVCGGWLFKGHDREAEEALRGLFTREWERLDTVFLMPLGVTTDGTLYYLERGAKTLVELLLEHASKIRILAVDERVQSAPAARKDSWRFAVSLPDGNSGKEIELIVADRTSSEPGGRMDWSAMIDAFGGRGIQVTQLPVGGANGDLDNMMSLQSSPN